MGTDAQQQNNNLLLSDDARVDTKPQLEIYADDVKCSHGATSGQLDPAMVFFLRARGLDEKQARAVLTYAFANEIVQHVAVPGVQATLASAMNERFHWMTDAS
jgi:Fe-S cluster assembly protein SufD